MHCSYVTYRVGIVLLVDLTNATVYYIGKVVTTHAVYIPPTASYSVTTYRVRNVTVVSVLALIILITGYLS